MFVQIHHDAVILHENQLTGLWQIIPNGNGQGNGLDFWFDLLKKSI
jgi:hypothetical protein